MTVLDPYQVVFSQGGYPIGHPEPTNSYWAIKLNNNTWLCEMDTVDARIEKYVTLDNPDTGWRDPIDLVSRKRNLDWTLDVAAHVNVWSRITELWLVCPPTPISPAGNTARLPISPAGTAFQLKVSFMDSNLGTSLRRCVAQMIGRVTNQETGECEVWCFDHGAQALIVCENDTDEQGKPIYGPWKSNVYNLGTWRPNLPGTPSIAPIGRLAFDVVGLHFGDHLKYEDDCGCGDAGKGAV